MDKLLLIDGNSIMNRAFYGTQSGMLQNAEGLFTGAVFGFLNIFLKVVNDEKPTHVAVAFDLKAPTFRHKMYEGYKATRKGMPPELAAQMPVIKEVLAAMNCPCLELPGFEADDIIGTCAVQAEKEGLETLILTGDKDSLQLVTERIHVLLPVTKQGATTVSVMDIDAVKERLLAIRERIINGEKFSTLARIYSQDPGSARKGGELGMASKSIFWPAFSDAAMSLKPGVVSQIVETPDGFHIIEVLEKKGDMFNARHILLKPEYTVEDRTKAFKTLDSLKTELNNEAVTFEMAARFYSEDPATRTNGGQMADPATGSSYFEIDQLKPQDYTAISELKEGEISDPVESLDNEGRNGNTVYKIIKVDKIIPAHPATFSNDYTLLLGNAEQELRMKAIDDFIDEKIKSTYIVIDPMFEDCVFERDGWYEKFRKAE